MLERFGLPLPASVAPVGTTVVGSSVTIVGRSGVVKDCTVPKPVPSAFEAMAQ